MPDSSSEALVAPPSPAAPQKVSWGPTSTIAAVLAIVPLIGGTVQAIIGRDAPGLAVAGGGLLVALVGLGGRYAQSVALARRAATVAGPWIDALQAALASSPPGTVTFPLQPDGTIALPTATDVEPAEVLDRAAEKVAKRVEVVDTGGGVPVRLDLSEEPFDVPAPVTPFDAPVDSDDLEDGAAHELTDGDPDAPVALEADRMTDEAESRPDPEEA